MNDTEHTLDVTKLDVVYNGLLENMNKLSVWERSFVDNTYGEWSRTGSLTGRQLHHLEKCWLKI